MLDVPCVGDLDNRKVDRGNRILRPGISFKADVESAASRARSLTSLADFMSLDVNKVF